MQERIILQYFLLTRLQPRSILIGGQQICSFMQLVPSISPWIIGRHITPFMPPTSFFLAQRCHVGSYAVGAESHLAMSPFMMVRRRNGASERTGKVRPERPMASTSFPFRTLNTSLDPRHDFDASSQTPKKKA